MAQFEPLSKGSYADKSAEDVASPSRGSFTMRSLAAGVRSPKTTLAGSLPAIFFIVHEVESAYLKHDGEINYQTIAIWLTVAVIAWFSRDNDVSSEEAKTK